MRVAEAGQRRRTALSARSQRTTRRATVAVVAALALVTTLFTPRISADAAVRAAGAKTGVLAASSGNQYDWQDFVFPTVGPLDGAPDLMEPLSAATDLRTGSGTGCPPPSPFPARNAGDGSGTGYQVPFLIKISNGRMYVGYSSGANQLHQLPFQIAVIGITGWVRGWVSLPSMAITVPDNGLTLCDKAGLFNQAFRIAGSTSDANGNYPMFPPVPAPDSCTLSHVAPGPCGSAGLLIAAPLESAGPGVTRINGHLAFEGFINMDPVGTVSVAVAGVEPDGSLDIDTTVTVHAVGGVTQVGNPTPSWECQDTPTITMGTGPQPLLSSYAPIPNPYPAAYAAAYAAWIAAGKSGAPPSPPVYASPAGQGWNVAQMQPPFSPPRRNWLPTASLNSATTGGTGTAGSTQFQLPQFVGGPGLVCNSSGQIVQNQKIAPIDPRTGKPMWVYPANSRQISASNAGVAGPMAPGSGQASIQMQIADIGIRSGMPSGFGFS